MWTREFGTSGQDVVYAMVLRSGGVYVGGATMGALPGQTSAGSQDAFVRKYDLDGTELWTRQFGTSGWDTVSAIAAGPAGVYAAGSTSGAFDGQTSSGGVDAFVRKYSSDGDELWTRQFGDWGPEGASAIVSDGEGVYVAGTTSGILPGQTSGGGNDAFLRKYDAEGSELWTRQFSSSEPGGHDFAQGLGIDASGLYIAGDTTGGLPGQVSQGWTDAFVRKYSSDGDELWTRQFGSPSADGALAVVSDGTAVYAAGWTLGALPGQASAGSYDMFVRAYDVVGTERWTNQSGTPGVDVAHGISVDASRLYVAGETAGVLPGQASSGKVDAFLRMYDAAGSEAWTAQFGTPEDDIARATSEDALMGLYLAGSTRGTFLNASNAGGEDAFVMRLRETAPPPPTGCPLSHGFWKTHPDVWPVNSLDLGDETYGKEDLLSLLRTPPKGDASVILAHQLVAAKLNVANGSDPAPIASQLADADDLLGAGRLPLGIRPSTKTGQAMVAAAESLDDFNNGRLSAGCPGAQGAEETPGGDAASGGEASVVKPPAALSGTMDAVPRVLLILLALATAAVVVGRRRR